MAESLQNILAQIQAMPPQRQMVLLGTSLVSLAFLGWIATGMGNEAYRSLYRGLEDKELVQVTEALRGENIPYRLDEGGTSVSVPESQLYEARLRVAGKGLPSGGSAGFELFDRPAFGVTDFVHRVNYARAVQGELARTVEQLEPVERARVQVVIPERSGILASKKREPSASVVVALRPGRTLEQSQVRAVVHLVASSIESLSPKAVTVVDGSGRLLAPIGDDASGKMSPGGAPAHQTRVESELARRVETILEPVVGIGGVVARVRADMNWTEQEVTEERFDPDSQVARSEQRSEESESTGSEGGVPGVAANTPGTQGGGANAAGSTRSEETTNYEISKTISHRTTPMGRIERLSVAVLIDAPPMAEGSAADAPSEPWGEEDIERFEQLAMQAVGYSKLRGDEIVVTSAPFRLPDVSLGEPPLLTPRTTSFIMRGLGIGAQLLVLLLFARLVVKPLAAAVTTGSGGLSLPATVASLEGQMEAGALGAGAAVGAVGPGGVVMPSIPAVPATLAEEVGMEAEVRGEDSVTTIRNWLNQE